MNGDRVFFFEDHASIRSNEFHERAPGHMVGRLLPIEQAHEPLFPLVFLPVIESVHAVEASEDAMLPRMVRRFVFREHDPARRVAHRMEIRTRVRLHDVSREFNPVALSGQL